MLLDRFFPPDIRVEKEARTLLKANHEVFLLSRGKDGVPSEELVEGIRVIREKVPQNLSKRTLRTLPKRGGHYLWRQVSFVDPFWKKILENAISEYQIEALHIHDLPLVSTGLSVAHKLNIPLIADLHENYPEAVRQSRMTTKPVQRILNLATPLWRWKRLERFCVQQADRVITVVDEAKQHYVSDCGIPSGKVTVVMNTEDLDYFHSLPIKEDIVKKYQPYFTISYVGGFGWHRGIQTAISAMPEILHQIPNARLVLVGTGANESDLRELARKKKVEPAVEFTGWQDFNLVPSYISASRICLIPYIRSGNTNASCPHKLFQYMAMGKPVIASSMDSLRRIIIETGSGMTYPSGNTDALAEAVIKIYRDRDLAIRMGEAGKRAVKEKYNWEAEGKKLIKLYKDLK